MDAPEYKQEVPEVNEFAKGCIAGAFGGVLLWSLLLLIIILIIRVM